MCEWRRHDELDSGFRRNGETVAVGTFEDETSARSHAPYPSGTKGLRGLSFPPTRPRVFFWGFPPDPRQRGNPFGIPYGHLYFHGHDDEKGSWAIRGHWIILPTLPARRGRFTRKLEDMRRRLFRAARIAVGVALSVGLGWLAIRGLDWGLVGDNLVGVSIPLLLVAVAVFMFASWIRAVRWRILFVEDAPSIGRLFIVQNEGIGINNVLPFRIASEVTQLAVLTLRDGIKGATALATLGMERVIDVVASTAILAVAFFLVPEMENFTPFVLGAFAFALLAVGLVRAFAWGSEASALIRRFKFLASFADAVRVLEKERRRLFASTVVSIGYWVLVGVTAWIIAEAIDLPISPVTATAVIMGTIFFATAVPAAPSAVGTFEFAVVYVLDFFGIDRSDGFGFAVIVHVVFFLPPTIIAAIFLPREGVLSFRRRREEEAATGAGE